MGADTAAVFWIEMEKYHDLAEEFERNIEVTHPSRAKGECSHICGKCSWAASTVVYQEYRGERVA